jgi:hypothetical protein
MSKDMTTSRRSFLKSGAIAAAPVAAIAVPAAAFAADDGGRAKLARLEDERAIADLHHELLRQVNAGGARAHGLDEGLRAISPDAAAVRQAPDFSPDGQRASQRQAVTVELAAELTGDETLLRMARLQGNTASIASESRVLIAKYVRRDGGWAIDRVAFA